MNYTDEFQKAVNFCKNNNLFLGYGNPTGKVLMIGKEQYFKSKFDGNTDDFYNELLEKRNEVNEINIQSWIKNLNDNFKPDWDNLKDPQEINSNAQTIHWNQKNKQNKQLKNGEWNFGTSSTYLQYQKIYQIISDLQESRKLN